MSACVCAIAKDNLPKSVVSFHYGVLGTNFKMSDWAADVFTYWAPQNLLLSF